MDEKLIDKASSFCLNSNILYSRSALGRTFEQVLFYELSQEHALKPQFRTYDSEREIERVTVQIDGYQLTYHFGWKHRDDHFKEECINQDVCDASLKFLKILNQVFKRLPKKLINHRIFRAKHRCLGVMYDMQSFIATPVYWEMIDYIKIPHQ
jgi:hypothetical protein